MPGTSLELCFFFPRVSAYPSQNFIPRDGLEWSGGPAQPAPPGPRAPTPLGFLMVVARAGTTQLSNITDLTVCANVWLAVVLMMCCIYILGIVSL